MVCPVQKKRRKGHEVRKINNSIKHDPENGSWGNCHSACIAMILGMDINDVPHFYKDGEDGDSNVQDKRVADFLDAFGLIKFNVLFPGETLFQEILTTFKNASPGVAFILGGKSSSGCGHSVVCLDGEIFHDPTGSGIVGPMDDGYFWVTVFSVKPNWLGRSQ